MKKYLIYIVFGYCFGSLFAQDNEAALFNEATQHYADEQYEEAIKKYEAILGNNKVSAAVYYNLGNAHYKLDHIAPSVYNYEKALQLAPNDEDIQNNLAFAQNMTIDAIETLPKTGLSKIIDQLISKLSYNGWAWLAVIASFVFALGMVTYYFSVRANRKRFYFAVGVLSFLVGIVAIIFAYLQLDIQQSKRFAIVFSKEISVHAEPNTRSNEVFLLHEGTKVKVLDTFSGYAKIELANGEQGWTEEKAIKAL